MDYLATLGNAWRDPLHSLLCHTYLHHLASAREKCGKDCSQRGWHLLRSQCHPASRHHTLEALPTQHQHHPHRLHQFQSRFCAPGQVQRDNTTSQRMSDVVQQFNGSTSAGTQHHITFSFALTFTQCLTKAFVEISTPASTAEAAIASETAPIPPST